MGLVIRFRFFTSFLRLFSQKPKNKIHRFRCPLCQLTLNYEGAAYHYYFGAHIISFFALTCLLVLLLLLKLAHYYKFSQSKCHTWSAWQWIGLLLLLLYTAATVQQQKKIIKRETVERKIVSKFGTHSYCWRYTRIFNGIQQYICGSALKWNSKKTLKMHVKILI